MAQHAKLGRIRSVEKEIPVRDTDLSKVKFWLIITTNIKERHLVYVPTYARELVRD